MPCPCVSTVMLFFFHVDIGFKSCADLLQAGNQETGYYEIDPDGPGIGVDGFLVFCHMCEETETVQGSEGRFLLTLLMLFNNYVNRVQIKLFCHPAYIYLSLVTQLPPNCYRRTVDTLCYKLILNVFIKHHHISHILTIL